jgi:pyruvate/2-oxoglutarate dehydrogenase complex dihydrolipoamide dehydrogenase (E3) component
MAKYDIIWIGTGQATGTVVPRLVKAGKTVAIVEGGRFGGSCVNYGCTPTKTLVASARAAHMARRGPDFGVITGEVQIDFARVMERANAIRHSGSQGLEKWLRGMKGVTTLRRLWQIHRPPYRAGERRHHRRRHHRHQRGRPGAYLSDSRH